MQGQRNGARGATHGTPDVQSGGDQAPVTITTNRRHLETIRSTLLLDLSKQMEAAVEEVQHLGELPNSFSRNEAHDVRSQVSWIVETIETLDDLGWAREAEWKGYRA